MPRKLLEGKATLNKLKSRQADTVRYQFCLPTTFGFQSCCWFTTKGNWNKKLIVLFCKRGVLMQYFLSFLLGIPFSVLFFISITYLNDNTVVFSISIVICIALISMIANPILKRLSGSKKYETVTSFIFILGLVIPLFFGLIFV